MNKLTAISVGLVLLAGLLFTTSINVTAQQEKGDQEFQINGNIFFNVRDAKNTLNGSVGLAYGYFLTENHQVGFQGNATFFKGPDDYAYNPNTNTIKVTPGGVAASLGGEGFYRYNFKASEKVRPYVGISAGTFGNTFDTPDAVGNNAYFRPNAGLKYYFKRNVALDFNAGYQAPFKQAGSGNMDARIGIAFIF